MPLFETLQSFSVHGVVNASQVNAVGASSSAVYVNAAPAATTPAKPAPPVTSSQWKLDKLENGKCHWEGDRRGIRHLWRRVRTTTDVDAKTGVCPFPVTTQKPAPAPAPAKKA